MGSNKDIQQQRNTEHVAPREIVPEPGRQTLVQQQQQPHVAPAVGHKTGNALVDQNLACNVDPTAAGCVLSPEQRAILLPTYQSRVTAAQQQYVAALIELRVDELLKKEPEQNEIMLELFLEIISSLTVASAGKAIKLLRGGAVDALEKSIASSEAFSAALREGGEKQVETAIKSAAGMGKKKIIKAAGDDDKQEITTQKTAHIGYIDLLKDRSATIYENLREGAIAGLDDVSFLVLFESFRAENGHTVGAYKEALQDKMKRFDKSGLGKLGKSRNEHRYGPDVMPGYVNGPAEYDTKAFWVKTPKGLRLGLYRREYQEIPKLLNNGDPAMRRPASAIETAIMTVQDAERPYQFVSYVPIEFEEAAVAMHRAKWHSEPIERDAQSLREITMAGIPS